MSGLSSFAADHFTALGWAVEGYQTSTSLFPSRQVPLFDPYAVVFFWGFFVGFLFGWFWWWWW